MITGCRVLDGYIPWRGGMILVYGIAGSGKTTLLLEVAGNICRGVDKCIYISTGGTLHYDRVAVAPERYSNVFFVEFYDFDSLEDFILHVYYYMPIRFIFIDSINALYREIAYKENSIQRMGLILGVLKRKITISDGLLLASAQVRAGFEEDEEEITASGMSIYDYWFDVIIRLGYLDGRRYAEIVKPLEGSGVKAFFDITDKGIIWLGVESEYSG